jgi:hypothetical protein
LAARGALRIEVVERRGDHFKGTLTWDEGPTTWVIRGAVNGNDVEWQWGDVAATGEGDGTKLTNNARFTGKCKDGTVEGRFVTLDGAQGGKLRAPLVGPKVAGKP